MNRRNQLRGLEDMQRAMVAEVRQLTDPHGNRISRQIARLAFRTVAKARMR